MNLIFGGVEIPQTAALDLSQTYEPLGGSSLLRMSDGSGVKMTRWTKTRTSISGAGWIPPGLDAIDYSAQIVVDCVAPRAVLSATTAATIPAARRPDVAPWAFAIMSDGRQVPTTCSMVVDAATAGAVSGAVRYVFQYLPRLTVFADPPRSSYDVAAAAASWSIDAEEV